MKFLLPVLSLSLALSNLAHAEKEIKVKCKRSYETTTVWGELSKVNDTLTFKFEKRKPMNQKQRVEAKFTRTYSKSVSKPTVIWSKTEIALRGEFAQKYNSQEGRFRLVYPLVFVYRMDDGDARKREYRYNKKTKKLELVETDKLTGMGLELYTNLRSIESKHHFGKKMSGGFRLSQANVENGGTYLGISGVDLSEPVVNKLLGTTCMTAPVID